jgi:hypothetical protein
MKKIALILFVSSIPFYCFSQSQNYEYSMAVRQINIEQNNEFLNLSDAEFKLIEGSPYAHKEFMEGSIFEGEELLQKNVLLRYNIFSDEIEIKKSVNDKEYSALVKRSGMLIKIFNEVYTLIPFEGSDERGQYFKVLTTGEHLSLYKKSTVEFIQRTFAKTSYDRDKPAKFTQTDTYFLATKAGNFVEMPDSKSKVLKLMKNKESEIKAYFKSNRPNLKDEKYHTRKYRSKFWYNSL